MTNRPASPPGKPQVVVPSPFVHTPSMVSRVSLEAMDEYEKTRAQNVIFGVPSIDAVVPPLRPGDLSVILAGTSHLKTTFMQWMAITNARMIGPKEDECIVYVSWEDPVPELGINDLARATGIDIVDVLAKRDLTEQEWKRVRQAGSDRAMQPIYVVGYTPVKVNGKRQRLPPLTMEEVTKALLYIENSIGLHARAVFLDYVQRIPAMQNDRGEIERNSHNMERAKDQAITFATSAVIGCQAKRECLARPNPLPGVTDPHQTSTVEHLTKVMLSLLYPIRVCPAHVGEEYGSYAVPMLAKDGKTHIMQEIPADEHLGVVGIPKSKKGKALLVKPFNVDVVTGVLSDYHDPNAGGGEIPAPDVPPWDEEYSYQEGDTDV